MKNLIGIALTAGYFVILVISIPVHAVNKKIEAIIMKPFN